MKLPIKSPMLACTRNVEPSDLQSLQYPLYGTPKLDGIRMLIIKDGKRSRAYSRALKLIPNAIVQAWVEDNNLPEGLDGEIIIPGATFNQIQSKVMTEYTLPFKFEYWVFDHWYWCGDYINRTCHLAKYSKIKQVVIMLPERLSNAKQVLTIEQAWIDSDFEGIILRSGDGPYKQGRSTWNEGYMLKMKRFTDCEGVIEGFEEKLSNQNSPFRNELGMQTRSKHQANMVPTGTMGKMFVRSPEGKLVTLGGGWDAALAKDAWLNQKKYIGQKATYKKQTHGEKDNPRIATFKGIRYD